MPVPGIVGRYIKKICTRAALREIASREGLRAMRRLFELGALVAVLVPAQLLIAGPLFRDRNTVPRLMGRGMNRIMGIHTVFNGVAPVTDRPAIYVANHISWTDALTLGSFLQAAALTTTRTADFPVMGRYARSIGCVFIARGRNGQDLAQVHGQIAQAINAGQNIVLCPEARSFDGTDVHSFKSGALGVLFDNASAVPLRGDVCMQPFALRLTHIEGKKVTDPAMLREAFNWFGEWTPESFWNMLKKKSLNLEMTGLPVMNPRDYSDRHAFAKAAEQAIHDKILLQPG